MAKLHHYQIDLQWTGNKGEGTSSYRSYERSHSLRAENKAEILASSDPVFRGDKTKYNPEDLLVASLSGCHMLTYLHLCAVNGVVVVEYKDNASGTMEETPDGGGHFLQVTLTPVVTVSDQSMMPKANELHEKASELCFIASSVNFPVHHKASCQVKI
jgi:organic hydroperoxide reductase OsmC/OhrA